MNVHFLREELEEYQQLACLSAEALTELKKHQR
jgi:hypothetical protein